MDSWTEQVKRILDRAPTRALPLSRLLQLLKEEGVAVSGREEWILRRITEQPEAFKVIPDRLGPWVVRAGDGEPVSPWFPSRRFGRDPWVMACSPVTPTLGLDGQVVGRIQESLQAWGREDWTIWGWEHLPRHRYWVCSYLLPYCFQGRELLELL